MILPRSHRRTSFKDRKARARARIEWLVRFAEKDLPSLSSRERARLTKEFGHYFNWVAPPYSYVSQIHDFFRKGLQALFSSGQWGVKQTNIYGLSFANAETGQLLLESMPLSGFDYGSVIFDLASVRLPRCPECGKHFVASKTKRYCSTRCSQTVRTRRWRKEHPDKAREIRHVQHLKRNGLSGRRLQSELERWRENEKAKRRDLQRQS
jgi:endogenous inhibitor of DNA gyrase (YacG/DUF329 family)